MNKKYIVVAVTCGLLLIAGICYSYALKKDTSGKAWDLTQQQDIGEEGSLEPEASKINLKDAPDQVNSHTERSEDTKQGNAEEELMQEGSAYAHICGAVLSPGVYPITVDCRVVDLVELAGGFTAEAAKDYVNQALKVQDGQRVYIPTQTELTELSVSEYMAGGSTSGSPEQTYSVTSDTKLININTASASELMGLPGVGEAKAASIIEYRNTNGKFKTIRDLMKISGIKEGLFNKISGYITVK